MKLSCVHYRDVALRLGEWSPMTPDAQGRGNSPVRAQSNTDISTRTLSTDTDNCSRFALLCLHKHQIVDWRGSVFILQSRYM